MRFFNKQSKNEYLNCLEGMAIFFGVEFDSRQIDLLDEFCEKIKNSGRCDNCGNFLDTGFDHQNEKNTFWTCKFCNR